ncbi:hypothetical protein IF128_09030 [Empedobacter stercoris]|uniref:DUF5689 domain-containing protein n=1 Tax=Empedobacter stercoris TaxID=1628248 RepID=UPI001662330A|nr:DUF5689 domain-containing protein [Empedobacter stercoris]MCA4809882.1 hypothetical protein [Empedobacter stercoris]QNT15050.1 hypothetical protein HNV03_10470 [Empedobacter stercoris]
MNTITKLTIATALSLGLFTAQSCVQDDDYSVPSLDCPQKKEANITIKDLLDQVYKKTLKLDDKGMVADDLIVEGIVITSDESGNLANTISFQDKASGATAGIQIELAERPVYGFYPIGSTVQVNLKGLKVAEDRGTIRIGTKIAGSTFDLDRMPKELREKVFIKTCDPIQAIAPKEVNSLAEALRSENVNTLVKIKNVQFKSPDTEKTYYPDGSTATADNVSLIDKSGTETDLRTSKYASFKDVELPTGSGEITVLVSKYNSSYQVYIRDTKDVNFDQPRFDVGGGQNPDGGNDTEAANLLFKGSDFNVWADFMSSINAKFGLKDYATSAVGLGRDDSNALQIKGTPAGNDYVFTAKLTNELPTNPKKITFYVKGKSGKSLSLNVNKSTTGFTPFNVGELANQPVTVSGAENNQYNGAIDTKGEWVLVTLNIEGLDIQKTVGNDLFSLKVGKEVAYDLIIDNIKID